MDRTALEAQMTAIETAQAAVEAQIKRYNGSDRDRPQLAALCTQARELARQRYALKVQLRSAR